MVTEASELSAPSSLQALSKRVDTLFTDLQTRRRDLHKYAESGWLEFRTSTIVAERLSELGYSLQLGREVIDADSRMGLPSAEVLQQQEQRALEQGAIARWMPHFSGGFTGIVATLETGRPGPVIGYRVDMDALDLNELQNDDHRPYREGFSSLNGGMMHACGHDGHTTIGLGLAQLLMELRDRLCGTIKLIFQPAEEGTRGAKSMVAAGVVDDVDFFTAVHIGTGVPANHIVCGNDTFMATTKLDVVFTGVAAHAGGNPEQGRNTLLAAAQATLGLHALPRHSAGSSRINVGVLQAGTGRNVVPSSAMMKVETRGATNEVNEFIYQQALKVISGAAEMYQVQFETRLMGAAQSSTPTEPWVKYIHRQAEQLGLFEEIIDRQEGAAGSEDATYMMERVKSLGGQASYVIFGTDLSAGHHNEKFDFDEKVMTQGIKTLAALALNINSFKEH
ncbi:M20 family metallo-hydrolase [Rouxiella badensis]|uniref:M20 family metallo-hydrolase n=1 Tax=Rouxiella badensis TaxID=1646377 RepID=UPI0022AAF46E|nr:M20 family metallo-hydrolase [Rouxiella badensis]WAT07173.1 M20 family metallo-hydrolase [Rouxiella badensis]